VHPLFSVIPVNAATRILPLHWRRP
jgi:hypothetical protein